MKNTEKYSLNNKFTLGAPYWHCIHYIKVLIESPGTRGVTCDNRFTVILSSPILYRFQNRQPVHFYTKTAQQ